MRSRIVELGRVRSFLEAMPVVGILGPRQVGKTILAQTASQGSSAGVS
ncbi:MAG: hypothetical protein ACLFO1_05095 [Spirochaetaceae bacterium]